MKDFKDYKRFPIQIGAQSIIVIHHFSNNSMKDSFELHDMQEENQKAWEYNWKEHELAAKQFFDQLEGHYCDAFLESIILEATKLLKESDDRRLAISKPEDRNKIDYRAQKVLEKAKEIIN